LTVTLDAAFVAPAAVASSSATLPGSSFLTRRAATPGFQINPSSVRK